MENIKRAVNNKVAPAAAENDRSGVFNWNIVSLFLGPGAFKDHAPAGIRGMARQPVHTLCLSIEEIAKACASSALLLVIQAVGSYPLIFAGNEAQKRTYCPMISEERRLMGYLVTEPGAGSDVQAIRCSRGNPATTIS